MYADHGDESRRFTSRSDETLRQRVASERRPATTSSDKPVPRRQTRHHQTEDASPRLGAAHVFSEGDVRPQPVPHQERVYDEVYNQPAAYNEDTAEPVRQPSGRRRSTTSPQPVDGGAPCHQPQPITSIHFDSGEIDSAARGANDVTLGLDADRCVFETTFPVHDRRQATRPTLQVLTDDEDYNTDEQLDLDEEQPVQTSNWQQQQQQGLSRWRTLEDIHDSSMDNLSAAVDDDGRGDTEDRRLPPTLKRYTPAGRSLSASTKRRSTSLPNRSVVGFFVDSDVDSADDSLADEPVEDRRYRHRDDGSGDQWSRDSDAESLQLEYGSEDWLEVQREIYRSHGRAEKMFDSSSPRRSSLRSTYAVPFRINQQPVRALTATGVAGPTVEAIKKTEAGQQLLNQSSIPTKQPASEKQPTGGEAKPNPVTNSSSTLGIDSRVQVLLLALLIGILVVGFVYKNTSPSTPYQPVPQPQPQAQPQPQVGPSEPPAPETSSWSAGIIETYFADVFE